MIRFQGLESLAAFPLPARAAREARRRHAHEVLGCLAAGEAAAQTEVDASFGAGKEVRLSFQMLVVNCNITVVNYRTSNYTTNICPDANQASRSNHF